MAKLYFIRHGQSTSNIMDTFAGARDDIILTPRGIIQAQEAGQKLAQSDIHFDRIIASPLFRAQRTALIIAESIGFDPKVIEKDPRLIEYDTGELTGKPRSGVHASTLISTPGAEDIQHFAERITAVLAELEDYSGTVLLVSHSGVARLIECIQKKMDPSTFFDLPDCPNATVTEI